ncbi:MAG: CvpA family protein [Candidatus Eremiobacteraeota bacterium]|nr:CvpA family protein [Candidatus Eremiobacteraeota bacterium]MBC5826988.1 CvpA family protein [Candidatus Eremiobacteraeota bacterium]
MTWIDLLVAFTLGIAFWGGYSAGLVREVIGVVALAAGWAFAGLLAGTLASAFPPTWDLSGAIAHLVAFWTLFLVAFAAVRVAGMAAERLANLPLLKTLSGMGGGLVGAAKAAGLLWLLLFVALFFPIDSNLRRMLAASASVRAIESLNRPAIAMIERALPKPARPFARLVLRRHRL